MEVIFRLSLVALVAVGAAWTVIQVRAGGMRWWGLLGAALSAFVLLAASFPEPFAWFWVMPQLGIALWLGGTILLGVELSKARAGPVPGGLAAVGCNVLALAISAGSFLVFLWIASVSAGGV